MEIIEDQKVIDEYMTKHIVIVEKMVEELKQLPEDEYVSFAIEMYESLVKELKFKLALGECEIPLPENINDVDAFFDWLQETKENNDGT